MTSFLYVKHIRIFDYPAFALPLRETVRANAHETARVTVVEIEHINKGHIRLDSVSSQEG
jgi:hypothetical protein